MFKNGENLELIFQENYGSSIIACNQADTKCLSHFFCHRRATKLRAYAFLKIPVAIYI